MVLDGCFYYEEQIEHFIKNLSFPYYVFTLKASLKTCIKRDSKRGKVYGEEAAKAVHKMVLRFDYGIVINTENKTVEKVVEEIVSCLKKRKN